MLIFVIAAALWALGHVMRTPVQARLTMLAILYAAVLIVHIAMPADHPLLLATGGSLSEWVILGVGSVAVWGYVRWLRKMRGKVRKENRPAARVSSGEVELERNARHIVLREIGGPGQKRLKQARVLVIGAGGLGSPALQYLAAAGVGTIGVIDDDVVDNSNLQRQVIHTDDRIGMPKVFSAEAAMKAQNPFLEVRPYNRRLSEAEAKVLFTDYDLILDGTDDVETRYLVNRTAVAAKLPLVSAAISQWEGQISVFDPAKGAPCYACIFPQAAAPGLAPSCAEGGVLGPLPGVMGAMMAVEAVKYLAGAGETLSGRMMIYDALYAETRTISVNNRPDCPVCGDDT